MFILFDFFIVKDFCFKRIFQNVLKDDLIYMK